ncbi:hypothetical protein Tco_1173313 [Tanacetum coccineum]
MKISSPIYRKAKGEVETSNHERKKSFPPWKQQEGTQRQNFKKGGFRNQQRSERKQDRFTLLTKTHKDIFALEKWKFKAPPPMTTLVEKRNINKFYEFHGEVGHNTDECMHLKKQIEEMLKARKLSHIIKELKQNSGKEQLKTVKKGETSGKDKALAILMIQPWERTRSHKITSSSVNGSRNAKAPGRMRSNYPKKQQVGFDGMRVGLRTRRDPQAPKPIVEERVKRNLDIFAWKPEDMTGVPRHIAEHRLNMQEGCSLVRQKKKGQAADRNQAIQCHNP